MKVHLFSSKDTDCPKSLCSRRTIFQKVFLMNNREQSSPVLFVWKQVCKKGCENVREWYPCVTKKFSKKTTQHQQDIVVNDQRRESESENGFQFRMTFTLYDASTEEWIRQLNVDNNKSRHINWQVKWKMKTCKTRQVWLQGSCLANFHALNQKLHFQVHCQPRHSDQLIERYSIRLKCMKVMWVTA